MSARRASEAPEIDGLVKLLGLGSADGVAELPFTIAEDYRLHLISGLTRLRGTYTGRSRVVELLRTVFSSVDGEPEFYVRSLVGLEPDSNGELIVALVAVTLGGDVARSWDLCSVSRHEDGRIVETWVISTSVANPNVAGWMQVANTISKPFSVECSRCGRSTDASFADLARILVPPWAWIPVRRSHRLWARCPACSERAWLELDVPALGSAIGALVGRGAP